MYFWMKLSKKPVKINRLSREGFDSFDFLHYCFKLIHSTFPFHIRERSFYFYSTIFLRKSQ